VLLLAVILATLSVAAAPQAARAAPPDVGYEGPSFAGLSGAATGEKPESKLWWNDGSWWGSLWDASTGGHWIHRLDLATQTWVNTGIALDPRSNSRADALWVAGTGKLYVASHESATSGGNTQSGAARVYRYSYNSATDTYALDSGFPVVISPWRSETLVIDRDSTGQLWATWVRTGQVYVNHSVCNPVCNDAAWGTPFIPNVNGVHPNSTRVSSDDISTVISFGSRIGLMWSNQSHDAWYFSVHDDSAGDTTWQASRQAFQGSDEADDHLNLATLQSDDGGRVFVAVKTSHSSNSQPLIKVLARNPATGSWASHTHSTAQYDQTRPILLIDESAQRLHVFTSDEGGGGVYHKSAPLSNISFANGKGTLVMWDDDSEEINNVTSTKQNLNSATGLVVLASNDQTDRYWHYYDPLGGTPPPPPPPLAPVANFSGVPTSGVAPLAVSFTDASTNGPTSWAWDFDANGTTDSTAQHPQHTYTSAGTYSVTLTATNGSGSGTLTRTDLITVNPSGGGGGGTQTFAPIGDAKVGSDAPNKNYGSTADLRVRRPGDNAWDSYLKFDLSGLGDSVTSAVLRLYVTTGTNSGGGVYVVANGWSESTITSANAPLISGSPLATLGAVSTGTWVEWNVTSAVTGDGLLSLAVRNSGGSGNYSSREGANPPQLIVTSSP
jgi:PKD repeat protein